MARQKNFQKPLAETGFGGSACLYKGEIPLLRTAEHTAPSGGLKQRITISDVAEQVGLTKGTVSRALNGYPDISERTRQRVARAAKQMGYTPLAHAQAIRTGRLRSIGLVLQISEHDAHAPFLTDFLAGVTTAASAEDWTLAVATANSDANMLDTIGRLIRERKADGFILPRTLTKDPRVQYLRGHDVPFVLYGRTQDLTGCAWFDILGEDAMAQAVLRLHALGHRRIGFVNGGDEYNFCRLRHQGYMDGLRTAGLTPDPNLVQHNIRRTADGTRATRALLALPEPPTALVFATDETALGAFHAAQDLGLKIGQDVSVIAYDGIPEGLYSQPPLTTFAVDNHDAGARLTQLLIRQIRGERPQDLRLSAPARLIVRGSDGPPSLSPPALARKIAGRPKNTASKGGSS